MDEARLAGWIALANDQQAVGAKLWELTKSRVGLNTDPRMMSCQLFARLWSHARAYNLLYANKFIDDGEIILRAAIEAAICLKSLKDRPAEFMAAIREDAASTVAGQIPLWTRVDPELGADATANVSRVFGDPPNKKKHTRLNLGDLAATPELGQLHDWHRHLSATAVHVTGLSLMKSVGLDDVDLPDKWRQMRRGFGIGMATAVLQLGMLAHAETIDARETFDELAILTTRFATLGPPDEV